MKRLARIAAAAVLATGIAAGAAAPSDAAAHPGHHQPINVRAFDTGWGL